MIGFVHPLARIQTYAASVFLAPKPMKTGTETPIMAGWPGNEYLMSMNSLAGEGVLCWDRTLPPPYL